MFGGIKESSSPGSSLTGSHKFVSLIHSALISCSNKSRLLTKVRLCYNQALAIPKLQVNDIVAKQAKDQPPNVAMDNWQKRRDQ